MAGLNEPVFRFEPFSGKQKKVLTWWLPESPAHDRTGIIADGAIRSGKTVSMALSFVMWAMETFDGQNFAMCGKTIGSFRRNVLAVLELMLRSRGYRLKDHRADNLVEIRFRGNRNYFYVFGGKDERAQDLIQGITLAGVMFDEVALMPESFVNQATARCSVGGARMWFNCNPEGPYHWFKENWIDRSEEKKLLCLHFTMEDNLSLSEEVRERYRSMYSGVFYKRYILGLWCMAEGLIYDMFDPAKHVTEKKIEASRCYVSCDYGTQNPTVFLLWAKDDAGKWICLREYYYGGREQSAQKTDAEYADDLTSWLGGLVPVKVIVDPSAASFIAELRKRGYRTQKANNAVVDGIRYVATLLNRDLIAFDRSCENTIREFQSYVWDDKQAAHGEDRPVKQFDHCMDAMRYFCYTVIRKSGNMSVLK